MDEVKGSYAVRYIIILQFPVLINVKFPEPRIKTRKAGVVLLTCHTYLISSVSLDLNGLVHCQ